MIIRKPAVLIPEEEVSREKLRSIERYARVCYKSESSFENNPNFVGNLIGKGHESVIEHEKVTVLMIVDRGITHEIVRHRIAAYSQESTRYCNYSQDKFGNEITVIEPYFFEEGDECYAIWKESMVNSEKAYFDLLKAGAKPEEARSVLPNSLKTEIVVSYNMREWRHFFLLRASHRSHPQMRQVAIPLLKAFQTAFPELFADIPYDTNFPVGKEAEIIKTDIALRPIC